MAQPKLDGKSTITGTDGNDVLDGGDGKDILYGLASNDILRGGNGEDELFGGHGDDWLDGGRGDDTLTGGGGADRFALTKAGGSDIALDFSGPATTTELTTVSFDDVPGKSPSTTNNVIPNGYAGLNWDNIYVVHQTFFPGSGYVNGTTSGEWVAFNGFAQIGTIDNALDFNVVKGNFTAAWNNDLNVIASAWDDGVVVGTKTFSIDTTEPTEVVFDFTSIDKITFEAFNGINGNPSLAKNFAMDDLVIGREVVVPGDAIALVGGTAGDIAAAVAGVTANGAGDAVVNYAGADMTLVGIAPNAVTADYFVIA